MKAALFTMCSGVIKTITCSYGSTYPTQSKTCFLEILIHFIVPKYIKKEL